MTPRRCKTSWRFFTREASAPGSHRQILQIAPGISTFCFISCGNMLFPQPSSQSARKNRACRPAVNLRKEPMLCALQKSRVDDPNRIGSCGKTKQINEKRGIAGTRTRIRNGFN